MRATVFQCDGAPTSPAARLDALADAARRCRGETDLIVCPELFATGYNIGVDAVRRLAEPVNGPFATAAARIARETGVALVYGYAERSGENVFNAACCVDASGRRVANHRKLYMSGSYEEAAFSTGDRHTVFELGDVVAGLLVCFDVEFPESVRALRRAGCDLVLVPTALVERWTYLTRTLVPTRAVENGVFLVYANYSGEDNGIRYCGNSVIVGPDGIERARAGDGACLIHANLDFADAQAARRELPYLEKLATATTAR